MAISSENVKLTLFAIDATPADLNGFESVFPKQLVEVRGLDSTLFDREIEIEDFVASIKGTEDAMTAPIKIPIKLISKLIFSQS